MYALPGVSNAILPGYPMLALSAVSLLGPPPATVLMAYCANRTLGVVNKTSARAIETDVGKLWRCMFTSPPCRKSGPVEPLQCSWREPEPQFQGQVSAAILFATTRIRAAVW